MVETQFIFETNEGFICSLNTRAEAIKHMHRLGLDTPITKVETMVCSRPKRSYKRAFKNIIAHREAQGFKVRKGYPYDNRKFMILIMDRPA